MKTKKSHKKSVALLLALCLCCGVVGSLAYFTDFVGNLDDPFNIKIADKNIDIVPEDPTDPDPGHDPKEDDGDEIEWIWDQNNPILNNDELVEPGDKVDLSVTLKNGGPNAMDVRETFVLHSSVDMEDWATYEGATASQQAKMYAPEYWLFKAATADSNGAFSYEGSTEIDGVKVSKIDAQTYMFEVPAFVLNGTSESVTGGVDSKLCSYNLVFDKYARNQFQDSTCKVEYLVEVKQHTDNGPANGWTEIALAEVVMGQNKAGTDVIINAVPDAN